MTAPRRIVEGQFYFVTRRTLLRMFFLRPHPVVNQMFEYCLAEAAARHGIELIAWCAMSNHYHAIIYDPDGRVPAFIERFHKMLAKALNVHYERFESIWSSDQTCLTRLVTLEDVFDKVVYVLSNPAAAHLVENIAHWPGSSSWTRMGRAAKTVRRPAGGYFSKEGRMPKTVELHAVAPRGLRGESYAAWIARVREAVKANQDEIAKERRSPVLGCKAVLATKPFDAPKTQAPRRKLRPHLACKDKTRMKEERRALKSFREKYRDMRDRLREGARLEKIEFPEGTYRLRLLGLRCAGCATRAPSTGATRSKRAASATRAKRAA